MAAVTHPTTCYGFHAQEWWEEGDGDYVAPELLRSKGAPSPAADIYSLGATLYECATGTAPCSLFFP
jgi:serine/threonine protein kinase